MASELYSTRSQGLFVGLLFSFSFFFTFPEPTAYIGIPPTDAIKLLLSQISLLIFSGFKFYFRTNLRSQSLLNTALLSSWCSLVACFCIGSGELSSIIFGKSDVKLTRTIIYGTDANAISVAKALKLEIPARFKLYQTKQRTVVRMLDFTHFSAKIHHHSP
jgi:hypothetical protein